MVFPTQAEGRMHLSTGDRIEDSLSAVGGTVAEARGAARGLGVLVVEDEIILRDALAAAIDGEPGLRTVGAVATCAEALRLVEAERPDVIIMDVALPDGDGVDATRQILQSAPGTRVLILTGLTRPDVLARAADAGAAGFLAKSSRLAEVIEAIRASADTAMLVEAATLRALLAEMDRQARTAPAETGATRAAEAARRLRLTNREVEVLERLGEGLDLPTIAERLYLSPNTARGHIKSLLRKLGAHSQLEAVVLAFREGLLSPDGTCPAD
jgi:DNA-binding NarL/FixJ family response regulator